MSTMQDTTTRRAFTFSGLLLSLAIAVLFGTALAPDAAADKKKPKTPTVAQRTQWQRDACEGSDPPGKLAVMDGPEGSGGNTTECKGGLMDGTTCINTPKKTTCAIDRTEPPTSPLNNTTPPSLAGNEDPTGTGAAPGGGAGGFNPTWGNSGAVSGGWVMLTSLDGGKDDKAKHDGKRKHHGRGGKRGRN
jgi:hypothetical protein